MPHTPSVRFRQNSSTRWPIAVTAPSPVTTTPRPRFIGMIDSDTSDRGFGLRGSSGIIRRVSNRVDWHTYFMNIARQVSTRSTCPRKHVGAVIVRDRTILSTGYNGSIRGMPHCEDVGCVIEDGHCVATVHAEANAILQAAKNGVSVAGAELYTTASPCWPCFKLIANAGVTRVYFGEFYRDQRSIEVAKSAGIELVDLASAG